MSVIVKQCKTCGRLFESYGTFDCPICLQEMDQSFLLIKKYTYDHPGANIAEISKGTDVPEKIVLRFLREGRLSIESSDGMLVCEKCGKEIVSGRFCNTCRAGLENALRSACDATQKQNKHKASAKELGTMHLEHYKR